MSNLAEIYNEHGKGTMKTFIPSLLNALRENIDRFDEICKTVYGLKPESILDAPCNMGLISSLVSHCLNGPKRVVGIDISEPLVMIAKELFGIEAYQADILTFDPRCDFELVMCTEFLEHVHNPQDYLRKLKSLSRKWVFLSVPIEAMPVDGIHHVAHISPAQLYDMAVETGIKVDKLWVLPSVFCEKPKWLGWTFLLGRVDNVA